MIRWFISSTFRDMMAERDLINLIVGPKFREELQRHGMDSEVIDLRWGLDTYELEEHEMVVQTISTCLKSIDETRPYIIIFLSERFGWIPKKSKENKQQRDWSVWIPSKIPDSEKSITVLEIEHALAQRDTAENCIICMRKLDGAEHFPENIQKDYFEKDPDCQARLNALKKYLYENYRDRIIEYTATFGDDNRLDNFLTLDGRELSKVLIEKMTECCSAEWQEYENKTWQEKEQLAAWNFIEDRVERFIGRESLVQKFADQLKNSGHVFLKGEHGSGKTSLVCKIAKQLHKEGYEVCCLFGGSSAFSATAQSLLEQIVFFLENLINQSHFVPAHDERNIYASWLLRYMELCKLLPKNKRVCLMIDALDQLENDSYKAKLEFLPNSKQISFLVTYTEDFEHANVSDKEVEQMPILSREEIGDVLRGILDRYQKQLFAETEQAVKEKTSSTNPLYLQLVAQELLLISTKELMSDAVKKNPSEIKKVTVQKIKHFPDNKKEAIVRIISDVIEQLFDNNIHQVLHNAIKLIAVTRYGLRFSDLQKILGKELKLLDFSILRNFLSAVFVYRDSYGRIDFSHSLFRMALHEDMDEKTFNNLENNIANHLENNLSRGDFVRAAEGFYLAQKTGRSNFAIDLLDEADEFRNPSLIKDIHDNLLSDNGDFLVSLVSTLDENHLDEKILQKFVNFFGGLFYSMFNDSSKGYELKFRLLSEFYIRAYSKIDCIAMELRLARLELKLEKYNVAKERMLNLIKAFEAFENLPENLLVELKKSTRYSTICSQIVQAYQILAFASGFMHDDAAALHYLQQSAEWLNKSESGKDGSSYTLEDLASLIIAGFKHNDGGESLENLLQTYKKTYEAAIENYNKHPTRFSAMDSVVMNAMMLARVYTDLDKPKLALRYAQQASDFSDMIVKADGDYLNSVIIAGMAKLILFNAKINAGDCDSPEYLKELVSEAVQLFQRCKEKNPIKFIENMLYMAEELLEIFKTK